MAHIEWHDLPPDYSRGTVNSRDRYLIQAVSLSHPAPFHGLETLLIGGSGGDRVLGYTKRMSDAKRIAEDHERREYGDGGEGVAMEPSRMAQEAPARRPWPRRALQETGAALAECAREAGPGGSLDWKQVNGNWVAKAPGGGDYRLTDDDSGYKVWLHDRGQYEEVATRGTLGGAMAAAAQHVNRAAGFRSAAEEAGATGSGFTKGQRVRWSPEFLEKGRKIDPRWYDERKDDVGTVDWIQRDGDVLVMWDGADTTTVHPPNRIVVVEEASAVAKEELDHSALGETPSAKEDVKVVHEETAKPARVFEKKELNESIVKEDFLTKTEAEQHAHQRGAAYVSGSGSNQHIYWPRAGGYGRRVLFQKRGKWHIGRQEVHVSKVPTSAIEIARAEHVAPAATNEAGEDVRKVHGKWAFVSRHTGRPLAYYRGSGKPSKAWVSKQERRVQYFKRQSAEYMETIRVGDRVTIVNRFGQQSTGRAVMKGPYGWVLNMGGAHGRPAIATDENIVKVAHTRNREAYEKSVGEDMKTMREASRKSFEAAKMRVLKGGGKDRFASLDEFTASYVETALWAEVDDDGEPLDENYSVSDFAASTFEQMKADCASFQQKNESLLQDLFEADWQTQGGHDFWLTRNRHGAGFWDRGADPEQDGSVATKLTEAAHAYGSFELYVGDDGKIYAVGHERAGRHGMHAVKEGETAEGPPAAEIGHAANAPCATSPTGEGGCVPFVTVVPTEGYNRCIEYARKLGPIDNPKKVYDLIGKYMDGNDQEIFLLLLCNTHGECRGVVEIARGQRSSVSVAVSDVMRAWLASGAEMAICSHVHPSGNAKSPSRADRDLTRDIEKAAALYSGEILFADHVIIGRATGQCYSIKEGKSYTFKRAANEEAAAE